MSEQLEAPDIITAEFVSKVIVAMGLREPIAPNAVYRCLLWGLENHRRLDDTKAAIAELAGRFVDD